MEEGLEQDEETSLSEGDEIACFEDDTESFMLRKRYFTFPGLPPVVLNQDFVSVEGTGGAVWRPSIQFSNFVTSEEGRRCLPLSGKSVLEISSGLGLGAVVAWHLGASPVVATDIDTENGPTALLARNVAENCGRLAAAKAASPFASPAVAPPPPPPTTTTTTWTPADEDNRRPSLRGDVEPGPGGSGDDRERAVLSQPRGRKEVAAAAAVPLAPPPIVQGLRWGDGDQLGEALVNFDGFAPDVVLACDVVFDDAFLPALTKTLADACVLRRTRAGARPRLCISHQKRNRARENQFFAGLAVRLGGGDWRTVHQRDDLSVYVFEYHS